MMPSMMPSMVGCGATIEICILPGKTNPAAYKKTNLRLTTNGDPYTASW
jgi:hypothetical protein